MKTSLALSLLTAGFLCAQPAPQPRPRFTPGAGARMEQRLTQTLSLTAEQQNKVHTALTESDVVLKGNRQKMQDLHTALLAAVKAGNEDQIDKISQDIATVHQQETAVRAKSMAKIYGALTADQKAKAGQNLEMLMGGPRPGFAGPNPRRRPGSALKGPAQSQQ